MKHNINNYINKKLDELKWLDKMLANKSGVSKSQVSKLKKGQVDRLTAETYYKIYTAFGDSCLNATKIVFGNIRLKGYKTQGRTPFGKFMLQFEVSKNSIEEISVKTGIDENRLKDLYFRKGSLEAYELLLIEKAVDKNQGELFEEIYGK
ncbi:helix-turn-helix domain-containing protein [Olivibacter sitiensis]|uniref:helix-turn-helix domain-containing protein n=1 Tax=Olivibacter sitiensis TaxID=376470 RepID=UPI000481E955|nr:helix-turn-helix domain-containing protein [Olivibacter sitiensis]